MKINAALLNQCIARTNLNLEDRKYIIAMALAKTIGYQLSIPSSAMDSPSKWYNDNHKDSVESLLATINETCLINILEVADLTHKVWKMRYRMVFDVLSIDMMKFLDLNFLDGSSEIPQIYRNVASKVGYETINGFITDVRYAMNCPEGV